MTLFEEVVPQADAPLADRLRPRSLDEVIGQEELLDPDSALRRSIELGKTGSLILWGPPGVGKTTLALLIAQTSGLHFAPFSAVLAGIKDVRAAVAEASRRSKGTMLFVDEIHRFNKAQQDAFLPHVEKGTIVLVGATTENPAFSVISPLLSRCRVVPLKLLSAEAIREVIARGLTDEERGLGNRRLTLSAAALEKLISHAAGDARRALTGLEAVAATASDGDAIDAQVMTQALQHRTLQHDKAGDHHYDLLSAFHKSLRNSDAQAAIYWLARIIEAGADPMAAARRMVAMACEDVGLTDPMALQVAVNALTALHQLGLPEGRLPLTEAAVYLAAAPKSNAVKKAIDSALDEVRVGEQYPVPMQVRNAPTSVHKQIGAGEDYVYAHNTDEGVGAMECLPDALVGKVFFEPGELGFEKRLRERMEEAEQHRRGDRRG
ncbi:MAG: replication-associated recombination protein A [Planctomycetota bacterium]|nr:replication-associated recombination protein A [Planctomycetota bacterium]